MTPDECNNIPDVNTYRTIDGLCNNLNNPFWGAEFEQQPRFISEVYENGGEYMLTIIKLSSIIVVFRLKISTNQNSGFDGILYSWL